MRRLTNHNRFRFALLFAMIMRLLFFLAGVHAEEIEIRKATNCGETQTRVPESQHSTEGINKDGTGKGMTPEEEAAFPKKIIIERPPLMARLKYLKEWKDDPLAVRKLLLFAEQSMQVPVFQIKAEKNISLTREQKLSIWDQIGDRMISLEEVEGRAIPHPVKGGDVPYPVGGEDVLATFELIAESQEQEASDFVVLFMSGHDDFELEEKRLEVLRNYLMRGGFLFADSCCGQKGFERGFNRLVQKLFPGKQLEVLPVQHPLFSLVHDLKKIRYTGREKPADSKPRIHGMQLGCRTAVLYSPDDVSCGWDGHMHGEYVEREIHYDDALKLGVNLIAYCLGYRKLGSKLPKFPQSDVSETPSDREIVFAQLRFQGDCDPDPTGSVFLIEWLRQNLNMPVFHSRILVNPDSDDLFHYPFLYMTGHGKIQLSDEAFTKLKEYFEKGGTLIADACCGDPDFDASFRQWIKKLLPSENLKWLKPDHPVYRNMYHLESVLYRPAGTALLNSLLKQKAGLLEQTPYKGSVPYLEAIEKNGQYLVFYSRFDLGCAWEKQPCLLCRGISDESEDSFQLFANMLVLLLNP